MLEVERWAELRREHFVRGVGIRELAKRTGLSRNTIRRALRSDEPPRFRCPDRPSKLDPFREEIQRLLGEDPRLSAVRVRELIEPLGFRGAQTIVNEYVRELRPLYLPRRTFQRTSYRPAEICQFDIWQPSEPIRVGPGERRRGYVVLACLGYSRAGAGCLVFSKEAPDLLFGMARCLWSLGGLPRLVVWDREGALHAGGGRPTEPFAALCGRLRLDWHFCREGDPQAKGLVERLQDFAERSFEPGRRFANERDFQDQLERWFKVRANPRLHKTLRCRPVDRLGEERQAMRALPEFPDLDRRLVLRVPPDPYLRFDSCDYSLDPHLVGRRVEVRISQREVRAVALDTGELAARHQRSFARHRTITALEHARALRQLRGEPEPDEPQVELRPLQRYDRLLSA
ncbi:MAG: IS21 family transposase [Actinomycetota bacterium]|nr:IS21 family transposase [Actinomycetota bacterium]